MAASGAAELDTRVAALESLFTRIAQTRMAGLPVMNTLLRVQAVGFRIAACDDAAIADGILVTPWFMNLVRVPLEAASPARDVGCIRVHAFGNERFEFIATHEPSFGSFEACSLYSPMFEFTDQCAATAAAQGVLDALRVAPPRGVEQPARRSFLFRGSPARATG